MRRTLLSVIIFLVVLGASAAAEIGLELRDVKSAWRMVDGERVIIIEGLVVNVSGETQRVPSLRVSVTDAAGVERDRGTFEASASSLAPGVATGFKTIVKNPPRKGSLSVDFVRSLTIEQFEARERRLRSPPSQQGCRDGYIEDMSHGVCVAKAPVTPTIEQPKERLRALLKKQSTGSGFVINSKGHILTNNHVVKDCREVRLPPGAVIQVIATDVQNDLALLEGVANASRPATFGQGRGVRPGDEIVVVGFPLQGLLTSDPSVTTGIVSALAGLRDDRRFLQITAPVQEGNSGSPLLDRAGNVVGVVVAKLDALLVAGITGDIPQNVNFAVSAWVVRAFLDSHDVPYETGRSAPKLSASDIAAEARKFTVLVECWSFP